MSEENNKKKKTTKDDLEAKKQQVREERHQLQQLLIQLTEDKIEDKFSDKALDRHNEKIKLISGVEIDLQVLSKEFQKYDPQYTTEFYAPVFRLLNLSGDPSSFVDRFQREIAIFKNEVIWSRFPKGQINELRRINKYKGYYTRRFWNYQGLNEKGLALFQLFMQQTIDTMAMPECTTNYEFRKKMFEKFQVPYQIEIDGLI
jgi:hypothetical protein